jgi:hypothetical protein
MLPGPARTLWVRRILALNAIPGAKHFGAAAGCERFVLAFWHFAHAHTGYLVI